MSRSKMFDMLQEWVKDINPKYQLEYGDTRCGNVVAIVEINNGVLHTHSDYMKLECMKAHIMGIKGALAKEYHNKNNTRQ